MIRAHVTPIVTRLDAVAGLVAFDAKVPDGTAPNYVVVYFDGGHAYAKSLASVSSWREWGFQTTSVGSTPEQARGNAERVQTALLDYIPTVTGRTCGPISHEASRPILRDDDISPPCFYVADLWRFCSVPV